MDLTWEKVSPFLTAKAKAQKTAIEPLLPVLELRLNGRYGNRLTPTLEPVFSEIAAEALTRRIDRSSRGIAQQSVGGASVRYDPRMPLSAWLLPGELADLDQLTGLGGGTRSVRMSAPDGQRFGNRSSALDDDCEE